MFDRCITTETDELVNIRARDARIKNSVPSPKVTLTDPDSSEQWEVDLLATALFVARCPGQLFVEPTFQQYRKAAIAALGALKEN